MSTTAPPAFLLPSAPRRAVAVTALAALHLGVALLLLQQVVVRPALRSDAPLVVRLLSAPSTPSAPPASPLPAPRRPRPLAAPAPLPLPAIVVAPSPSPAPADTVPAPMAAPLTTALATPTLAASAPAPVVAPVAPREIPPSAVQYRVLPDIQYPNASRRLREQGLVIVAVLVDTEGLPRQVQVQQSSGFERLDRAAVAGVWRARFQPYVERGQPVSGWARIPVPFELEP